MAEKLKDDNVQVNDNTRVATPPAAEPMPVQKEQEDLKNRVHGEQLRKMPTLFDLARAARLNPNEKRKVKATRQKTDSKGNPIGEPEEIELEESSVEEMF